MTQADFGTFQAAFRRLSGASQQRWKTDEVPMVTQTYFKALEAYPLAAVLDAAKECLYTLTRFPKIAEWRAVLERSAPKRPAVADVPPITPLELGLLEDAEALHYQREPCTCHACVDAGVWNLPLRFVPTLCGAGDLRAWHPGRDRIVVLGHWAHGDELKRWYEARDAFFRRTPRRLRPVLALIGAEREPGEEG